MGDAETIGYEDDIKPLFREKDQQRMSFAFDLWSYEDVKENAEGILERSRGGRHALRRRLVRRTGHDVPLLDAVGNGAVANRSPERGGDGPFRADPQVRRPRGF